MSIFNVAASVTAIGVLLLTIALLANRQQTRFVVNNSGIKHRPEVYAEIQAVNRRIASRIEYLIQQHAPDPNDGLHLALRWFKRDLLTRPSSGDLRRAQHLLVCIQSDELENEIVFLAHSRAEREKCKLALCRNLAVMSSCWIWK